MKSLPTSAGRSARYVRGNYRTPVVALSPRKPMGTCHATQSTPPTYSTEDLDRPLVPFRHSKLWPGIAISQAPVASNLDPNNDGAVVDAFRDQPELTLDDDCLTHIDLRAPSDVLCTRVRYGLYFIPRHSGSAQLFATVWAGGNDYFDQNSAFDLRAASIPRTVLATSTPSPDPRSLGKYTTESNK